MKSSNRLRFAMSGVLAGIVLAVLCRPVPLLLVFGVGPVVVGATVLTLFSLGARIPAWRALLAVLLSIPAYFVAFLTFAATKSHMQQHGWPMSAVPSDLGSDDLLGMLAAVVVASLGLECLALLLSRRWSMRATMGLLVGGIVSVVAAYVASAAYMRVAGPTEGFMETLACFGPLFVVGGAFTAAILGEQVFSAASPEGGSGHMKSALPTASG